MTVADLMLCAEPLIFENEDEEYSYSMQGTGFLAQHGGRYFGITSKHCLRTRTLESVRFELDEIRGSKEAGMGTFIYSSVVFKSLQLLAENAAHHTDVTKFPAAAISSIKAK
jgi:hypothetical protein